jgi:large subunit ribosomal protein L25
MKKLTLEGKLRKTGTKTAKELRKNGYVPCNLYGGAVENNVHFSVKELDLNKLLNTPDVYLLDFDIDGTKYEAILKDTEFHPVTDRPLHADFLNVVEGKPFIMEVPVKIEGVATGVKDEGGQLVKGMRRVKVKSVLDKMPDEIITNVESLKIGQSIKVRDIETDGFEILNAQDALLVAVEITRVSKSLEIEEPEETAVEGEEGTEENAAETTSEAEKTEE